MTDPAFTFEDVRVTRNEVPILRGITAAAPSRRITGIVGPSGAGKTTLLRLCNRLDLPSGGRVLFKGADVGHSDPLALRRRVGMVFQRPTLFPGTVRDNLRVALPDAGESACRGAMERVALDPALLERDGRQLSGGEAQRACLARTLITGPEALLLDEPTSALDARPRQVFERLARELAADDMSLLWVTHDLHQLIEVADHALVLVGGALAYEGTPAGAARVPELQAAEEPSSAG